jgi:hypothetical protein
MWLNVMLLRFKCAACDRHYTAIVAGIWTVSPLMLSGWGPHGAGHDRGFGPAKGHRVVCGEQ